MDARASVPPQAPAPGQAARVFFGRGEIGGVRPAEAHRHAEALGDRGAELVGIQLRVARQVVGRRLTDALERSWVRALASSVMAVLPSARPVYLASLCSAAR